MGCCSGRRSNDPSFFTSERPHFFKIIIGKTLRAMMLEIPKVFVRKYGCSLQNSVLLRLPNGAIWQVGVYENNDGVWLDDGWKEFADFYNLGYGHLILFEYKGSCEFQVLIFDNSAMEIKYPNYNTVLNEEPERSGRDKSKKNGDGRSTSTGGRAKLKAGLVEKKRSLTYKEKAEVLQRASAFQSENPYFMVVMQPRYIDTQYELGIPVDFARRHLGDKRNEAFCVSDGGIWPVTYHYYSKLVKPKATICQGWKSFVDDHNIKVGDLCVFELIKTSPIMLKVFIFRDDGSTS